MTEDQINNLITRRNKLTDKRDGLTDWKRVRHIDAQLAQVPPGQRNDVDLLLGRPCAVLPERAANRWSTDADRAAWLQQGIDNGKRLAAAMRGDYTAFNGINEVAAEIEETPRDWQDMRGDLGI